MAIIINSKHREHWPEDPDELNHAFIAIGTAQFYQR
jgi:hypothetical protein